MAKEKTVKITESELHTCSHALSIAMTIYSTNNAWSGYNKFEKVYDSLIKKESKLFKEKDIKFIPLREGKTTYDKKDINILKPNIKPYPLKA